MNPMRLAALWRHPVKSFQGESLDVATIESDGVAGDRRWGVMHEATGKILTGRRVPPLLLASARLNGDGTAPEVTLPDGTTLSGVGAETDAALSAWLDQPVRLVAAADEPAGVAQAFDDSLDEAGPMFDWTMPDGRFVDLQPLLVLTTASLRAAKAAYPAGDWDVRRFRPNLLVETDDDGWVEDGWIGGRVRVGDVEIEPVAGCTRCTMVIRPQPGGLERDTEIFKTIAREHGGTLGVWATVRTPGTVRIGDAVEVGLS